LAYILSIFQECDIIGGDRKKITEGSCRFHSGFTFV
jgi:hypothetical protein